MPQANLALELCISLAAMVLSGSSTAQITAAHMGSHEYHLVRKVKLGAAGGWDYFDVDPCTHRVFIPRTTHLLVVDPYGKVVGDIPNLQGAHAVAIAPDLRVGFTANDRGRSVTAFDLDTLRVLRQTSIGERSPDAILYDQWSQRVFTMNGDQGHDATAIAARTGEVVGTVSLGGKPEAAQSDEAGHIYVNIQDKNRIVEFDAKSLRILHTWPVSPCAGPSGLAIDLKRHQLIVGCRSQVMALVNYSDGRVLDSVPIGWLVDATAFDPGTGLAFASTYDAMITVAREDVPGQLKVVQTIRTQTGARTMALDKGNHNIYAVTANFGPTPAPTRADPRPRPEALPNTFTLLVFSQERQGDAASASERAGDAGRP